MTRLKMPPGPAGPSGLTGSEKENAMERVERKDKTRDIARDKPRDPSREPPTGAPAAGSEPPAGAGDRMRDLISLCKRRGFLFPSSELYGGLNACWDYGPLGVELKNN